MLLKLRFIFEIHTLIIILKFFSYYDYVLKIKIIILYQHHSQSPLRSFYQFSF